MATIRSILKEENNLRPSDTGLPTTIWIDTSDRNKKLQHDQRIKFWDSDTGWTPIELSEQPQIPESVLKQGKKPKISTQKSKENI